MNEMERLRTDVLRKIEEDPDGGAEALRWLWDRLARAGPSCKRAVEINRPYFVQQLDQLARRAPRVDDAG
jgi:hypothetical protein